MIFEVLSVPGHSPAHLAYHADGCLLSGDVLFAGSVGRVDLPGADWETLVESIRSLLDAYPAETVVYPGHGPATTLGEELARNPFLAELRAERTA
jgi:glyoxylase-like metal-dependent hydrolase (beta-lactamase superfamily II)